ncbi:MAG: ExbD/TolR family protein [Phycisphaerales bacterium]
MILAKDKSVVEAGVDLTPVIDMVFLLLIFFLAATTFQQTEREMQIALPQASASGPLSAALREIVINIDANGRTIVGGKALSADELTGMVRSAVVANPGQKVSIRGDRAAAYEHVARTLDICKGAGVSEPYLETIPLR